MANSFAATGLTQLASAMVAGLVDGGVLLNTIYRDAESDLVVGKGDSVTIREPQVIAAANFSGTASRSDIVEGKITVAIDEQPYSQVQVTAKEATLAVEDLAQQVIMPQVGGIAEYIDTQVAAALKTTTTAIGTVTDWNAAALQARETLSAAKVPMAGRYLAVAPDVAGALLNSTVFQSGNMEGAPAALADGVLGRIYGFTVVETPFLPAGEAVGYHRTAVAGVFRTPVVPQGAESGNASYQGVSAQVIYAYDTSALADVLTAQTLFGLGTSNVSANARAVKLAEA
jgi:hypothetical protein